MAKGKKWIKKMADEKAKEAPVEKAKDEEKPAEKKRSPIYNHKTSQ